MFSNVYLNLPPMSPMKQLVRKHQDMLLWYCNLFDIALKCYRNRGVFQVSQYFHLSVLWEYYIYLVMHFSYFQYLQIVPIHYKMALCKTGEIRLNCLKSWTVILGFYTLFFHLQSWLVLGSSDFPIICKIIGSMEGLGRSLLFIYFFDTSTAIYPMKFRGPVFKTHRGMYGNG